MTIRSAAMFKQPTLRYVLAAAVFCMLVLVMFASRSSMSFQAPSILSQTSIKGYGNRNVFDDVGNTTLGVRSTSIGDSCNACADVLRNSFKKSWPSQCPSEPINVMG